MTDKGQGMAEAFEAQKTQAAAWFRTLRDQIVAAFEGLEDSHDDGPFADMAPGRFEVTETRRAADDGGDAGGGLMSVLRGGRVFEKVGVNVSTVYGTLGERAQMAMAARKTVATVHEVVELGALDPEAIVTPGIHVHQIVLIDRVATQAGGVK